MKRSLKKFLALVLICVTAFSLTGCAFLGSKINSLNGTITGNTYTCYFYTNEGMLFMTAEGQKINISGNVVKEPVYTDGGWGYTKTLSSVVTITIDGQEIENCGSTVIFAEDGLMPDVNFKVTNINSEANGFTDNTIIAKTINEYKNYFGKSRVVVIQSQLGEPICAFSGDSVYWEVSETLPKTTKLMIDGKALYIHRANFQIIDSDLL